MKKDRNLKVTDVELQKPEDNAIQRELYKGGNGSCFDINKKGTPFEGMDDMMRREMDDMVSASLVPDNDPKKMRLKELGINEGNQDEFKALINKSQCGCIFKWRGNLLFKTVTDQIVNPESYIFGLEKTLITITGENEKFWTHIKRAFKSLFKRSK